MVDGGLYICMLSLHGLLRSQNMELGRDADTGGQCKYVVELARELGKHPGVGRVDLITRQVIDPKVHPDYANPVEPLGDKARIVRLPFGPRRYLRKETLWPHLNSLVDTMLAHFRKQGAYPDVLHGHYADAGRVGTTLSNLLEIPLLFTGHSLGRSKLDRMMAKGLSREDIQERFNIRRRIEAEEEALSVAVRVIVSTRQEMEEQYALYENYEPENMVVVPPGVSLEEYGTEQPAEEERRIREYLEPFLADPDKPVILALSRPDERKNITGLIKAYGESSRLQEAANLVVIAGNRDDVRTMEREPRKVLTGMLLSIDRYNLYSRAAYPKHHQGDDVAGFYRYAARRGGVFVNPALTEPFGLTLIEAAACGLPLVATDDGGPRDIVANCRNGTLVDALDSGAMAEAVLEIIEHPRRRNQYAQRGLQGVERHYSWGSHADSYVKLAEEAIARNRVSPGYRRLGSGLPKAERVIICDIDNTLTGSREAIGDLFGFLQEYAGRFSFGVATGRHLESAREILQAWDIPEPEFFITSVGTQINYGTRLTLDPTWERHITHRWNLNGIREVMESMPGLVYQDDRCQSRHKVSFILSEEGEKPTRQQIVRALRKAGLRAKVVISHDQYLDILPNRASKGAAIRHLAMKWGLDLGRFLVAGDSGNDEDMLTGGTMGVVVGNYSSELKKLKDHPKTYFARNEYAAGVLEGIHYYRFLEQADGEEALKAPGSVSGAQKGKGGEDAPAAL